MSVPVSLGAAVVGLGVGEQHLRAYRASGLVRVRWLLDLDPDKARRLAADGEGEAVARDLEQVLADPLTHVVSIASYDDAHAEQVVATLRAGKHVFVEKPLCRSPEELALIRAAWDASAAVATGRSHLASNLVLRGAPLYQWLRRAVQEGELGELYAFDGDYLYGRIEKITQGWRGRVEGYSVMQGGGVHLVDLMLWISGQRPAAVTAAGNRIATRGTAFRYPDFVAATYEFESGLVGRITSHFGCVHRHQHVVRVFGTQATFLYDDRGPRLVSSRDPSVPARSLELAPLPPSKGVLLPEFLRGILAGRDTSEETALDFDGVRACFAADRALSSGQRVRV